MIAALPPHLPDWIRALALQISTTELLAEMLAKRAKRDREALAAIVRELPPAEGNPNQQ